MSENNNPSIWDANAPNLAKESSTDLSKLWFDKAPGGQVRDKPTGKIWSVSTRNQSFLIEATFTPTQRPQNPPTLPTNNNLIKQHVSSPQRFQPQVTQPQQQQQQFIAKQNQQQSFRPFRPQSATMIQTGFGQTNTQV